MAVKKVDIDKKIKIRGDHSAVDVLEQAFHLLRSSFSNVALLYAVGTIPFVMCFLYFIYDMETMHAGPSVITRYALILTGFYFFKNWIQALFCRKLMAELARRPFKRMGLWQSLRLFMIINIVQPIGFIVHFFAYYFLFIHVPFSTSFFWSFYASASTDDESFFTLIKKGCRVALYMPGQNILVLSIFLLLTGVVLLNCISIIMILPWFLNTFVGIETTLVRFSGMGGLVALASSSTFWSVVCAASYLLLDPFIKAVYVIRVYYAESFYDGADILSEISLIKKSKVLIPIIVFFCCLWPNDSRAIEVTANTDQPNVEEFDTAIEETLKKREYNWRTEKSIPILEEPQEESFFHTIDEFVGSIYDWIGKTLEAIIDWFDSDDSDDKKEEKKKSKKSSNYVPIVFSGGIAKLLMYVLIFLGVAGLLYVIFKAVIDYKRRMNSITELERVDIEAPDLNDEDVTADALEEDQWRSLADELIAKGEYRLAMRAQFLAVIALLSDNNLLSIARYKSNRDYYYELKRRYHYNEKSVAAFADNLHIFEQVWYGDYAVSRELVEQFISTCKIISE